MTETPERITDPVEAAERILADLRSRLAQILARRPSLESERAANAFAALAEHDPAAQKSLSKAQRALSEIDVDAAALSDAIAEAERRLTLAQSEAEAARRKANALLARERLAEFAAAGQSLAQALKTIREATARLFATATEIRHLAGPGTLPRGELIRVGLERGLSSTMLGGPMRAVVPPSQRTDPGAMVEQWTAGAEARLASILNEGTAPALVDEAEPEDDEIERLAAMLGDGAEGETEEAA